MAQSLTSGTLNANVTLAEEKEHQTQVEVEQISLDSDSPVDCEDVRYNRKINRKLDLYLLPICCFIYLLGYLDRTNVGNARVVSRNLPVPPVATNLTLGYRLASPKTSN